MQDNQQRIEEILSERRRHISTAPSLSERYEILLKETFPCEPGDDSLFYPKTFTGTDAEDYDNSVRIFRDKLWTEVSFDILQEKFVQFLYLTPKGKIHYLPSFLRNFFDLRLLEVEFFSYFISDLENGFFSPKFEEPKKSLDEGKDFPKDLSSFESLTPLQSKMVALFLANVANLLPSDYYESQQAQRALTNYWGNYLLF
ncbi:DUF6714 family protein [Paracidovorax citrulli]|uniref:DUF6714 family protein n=1 Tax=Paracidovorax citrulli TaxID=80869 RepID=UPI001D1821DD|nr:DUF6714 family protein [Paracidovorax citrulli]UEG46825.1 hypothetical protein LKW27_02815 [Paracidovorax citrulli]